MLTASGKIKVESGRGRIFVALGHDFTAYYRWFVTRQYWTKINAPLYTPHITICTRKLYGGIDWEGAKKFDGEQVEFEYDPDAILGGRRKGFVMFYLKVYSERLEEIKKEINAADGPGYKGLHVTIGSWGKSGAKVMPWWPGTIEIK